MLEKYVKSAVGNFNKAVVLVAAATAAFVQGAASKALSGSSECSDIDSKTFVVFISKLIEQHYSGATYTSWSSLRGVLNVEAGTITGGQRAKLGILRFYDKSSILTTFGVQVEAGNCTSGGIQSLCVIPENLQACLNNVVKGVGPLAKEKGGEYSGSGILVVDGVGLDLISEVVSGAVKKAANVATTTVSSVVKKTIAAITPATSGTTGSTTESWLSTTVNSVVTQGTDLVTTPTLELDVKEQQNDGLSTTATLLIAGGVVVAVGASCYAGYRYCNRNNQPSTRMGMANANAAAGRPMLAESGV